MALTAKFWQNFADFKRLNQAASEPFHSIHLASQDNGTSAVTAVQDALARIQQQQFKFGPFFMAEPAPIGQWGPFTIDPADIDGASFGTSTEQAVKTFQTQADLASDGKAGMLTLGQMDNMLAFLEIPAPPPSPFGN